MTVYEGQYKMASAIIEIKEQAKREADRLRTDTIPDFTTYEIIKCKHVEVSVSC